MSSTSVTFRCGSCGNLLSIGEALRGEFARCPFCQQIIQVPAAVSVAASDAGDQPEPSGPDNEALEVANQSAPSSAPVSSSDGPNWGELLPPAPALPPLDGAPTAPAGPAMAAAQSAAWQNEPTAELHAADGAPRDNDTDATAELHALDSPAPGAVEAPAAVESPVAVEAPARLPWDEPHVSAPAPAELPATSWTASRTPPRRLPASLWMLAILIPYSLLATVALVYVLYGGQNHHPHPLESIQDEGLYEDIAYEGRRREKIPDVADLKEAKKRDKIDPVKNELPVSFPRLKIGQTGRFGGIEVTPLSVRRQKLDFTLLPPEREAVRGQEVLVLKLRIKNVSSLLFHPNDETFNRAAKNDVYTFLEIGSGKFYGVVKDPHAERVQGQDFGELLPGATMETLVVAFESPTRELAVEALTKTKSDEALTWRVHLRKGREDVKLSQGGRVRTVWVTTVVPVGFTRADIKGGPPAD